MWSMESDGHVYHKYIRADLAGLPEDLVERMREELCYDPESSHWTLVRDILTWHEQQKGGGE